MTEFVNMLKEATICYTILVQNPQLCVLRTSVHKREIMYHTTFKSAILPFTKDRMQLKCFMYSIISVGFYSAQVFVFRRIYSLQDFMKTSHIHQMLH